MNKFIFSRRRWTLIQLLLFLFSLSLFLFTILIFFFYRPKNSQNEIYGKSYPRDLDAIRPKIMSHFSKGVYLDYTGAGQYSDQQISFFRQNLLKTAHLSRKEKEIKVKLIKEEFLSFLGANPNDYLFISVASATQALKLLGEHFPWKNDSIYSYTRYNHNSVLGIRRYAVDSGSSFQASDWPINSTNVLNMMDSTIEKSLLIFPLEDNFAGTKPEEKEFKTLLTEKPDNWFIVGDTAAFLPTNPLNLEELPFDAIIMSFYKIFGFPNSGALVIRKELANILANHKNYLETQLYDSDLNSFESFDFSLSNPKFQNYDMEELQKILEDDPLSYEMALGIYEGVKQLKALEMTKIQKHVYKLTHRLYRNLSLLQHSTGQNAIEIYGNHHLGITRQGGIVAFNIKQPGGDYIGYAIVVKEASQAGFNLRGGCHCNPGACFESVRINESKVKAYFAKKTTCGDTNDIVDGTPLGAVRASLGWASTIKDVDSLVEWINDNYVF